MYRIHGKFQIFCEKWYILEEILRLISDEGDITCMQMINNM